MQATGFRALKDANNDLIQQLITDRNKDVNEPFTYGFTWLYWACKQGNTSLVEFLLQRKAQIIADDKGYTPLHICAESTSGQYFNEEVRARCVQTGELLLEHAYRNNTLKSLLNQKSKEVYDNSTAGATLLEPSKTAKELLREQKTALSVEGKKLLQKIEEYEAKIIM